MKIQLSTYIEAKESGKKAGTILRHTPISFNFWLWDPSQFGSWSEGCLKPLSSLAKPSDKCQRTHIIQNSFHGMKIIFCVFIFFPLMGGGVRR